MRFSARSLKPYCHPRTRTISPALLQRPFASLRMDGRVRSWCKFPEMSHRWIRTPRFPNPSPRAVHVPDADMIAKAVTMIDAAKGPLVIAGEMISNQNASTELTDFIAAGGLPVMSAYRRLDVMANSHTRYAGHLEINRFESPVGRH